MNGQEKGLKKEIKIQLDFNRNELAFLLGMLYEAPYRWYFRNETKSAYEKLVGAMFYLDRIEKNSGLNNLEIKLLHGKVELKKKEDKNG